jgi:hypothetical protein
MLWFAVIFLPIIAVSCKEPSHNPSAHKLQGLSDLFGANYPIPKARSQYEILGFQRKLQLAIKQITPSSASSLSAKQVLSRTILETIKSQGGIPRWQLRQILKGLLTNDTAACGGASCARVLDLNAQSVDTYLDSLHKEALKTPRPYSTDQQKIRETIIGSFKRDYDLPTEDNADKPVQFKHFSFQTSDNKPSISQPITYAQLSKIKNLTLQLPTKLDEDVQDNFSDLLKYQGLTHLKVVTNNGKMLRQIAPYADQVRHLEIDNLGFIPYLKLEDLAPLATLPYLQSLKINGVRIDKIELLREIFPKLRSLTIANPGTPLTDNTMRYLGDISSLRTLHFEAIPLSDFSRLTATLPRQLYEASYSPISLTQNITARDARNCPNLESLRYFASIKSMSIKGCQISGLDSIKSPVNWEILQFEKCRPADSSAAPIRVSGQFPRLLIVKMEDSPGLDLDEISRQDLTVKLAQRQRP